jgi:hypothetical protein
MPLSIEASPASILSFVKQLSHATFLQKITITFVILNIADAYLTQLVLAMGGVELNPLAVPFGSNMLVRGLLALVVATAILFAGKKDWLRYLNVLVLLVVVWNLWQYTIIQVNLFL